MKRIYSDNHADEAFNKTKDTLNSCDTWERLQVASVMVAQFEKEFPFAYMQIQYLKNLKSELDKKLYIPEF